MRRLEINDTVVEIDKKTAIGVTYQSYDIKNPEKPLNKKTNSFTIPSTAETLALIGNPQSVHSNDFTAYSKLNCNYWDGNNHILKNATATVEEISKDRVTFYVIEKNNIWDELKVLSWNDLSFELFEWMNTQPARFRGLGVESAIPSFSSFISVTGVTSSNEGFFLPYHITKIEKDNGLVGSGLVLNEGVNYNTGHFCIYVKTIFEFFTYKYGVDFFTSGGQYVGNLWDDAIASKMLVSLRNLLVLETSGSYYFSILEENTAPFYDSDIVNEKEDKTAYDFAIAFFQHINVIKDEVNEKDILLRRFDDIETLASVEDFGGKFSSRISFKPKLKGLAQENVIKFKSAFEDGSEFSNSKTIKCKNENIEKKKTLLEIDAYVNSVIQFNSDFYADLSPSDSIKNFSFLIGENETSEEIDIFEGFRVNGDFLKDGFDDNDYLTFQDTVISEDGITPTIHDISGSSDDFFGSTAFTSNVLDVRAGDVIKGSWDGTDVTGFSSVRIYYSVGGDTSSYPITDNGFQYTAISDGNVRIRIVTGGSLVPVFFSLLNFKVSLSVENTIKYTSKLKIANLYDLNSEYNFYEKIITYPKLYTVKMWLTIADLYNLEFFKQYYIKELGASFFISKITGFNTRSKAPTTVELIKTSNKTPITPPDLDVYVDGVGDPYTDGVGDVYY